MSSLHVRKPSHKRLKQVSEQQNMTKQLNVMHLLFFCLVLFKISLHILHFFYSRYYWTSAPVTSFIKLIELRISKYYEYI